jgi:RNA polymerase sigma-70 factor (ECF subfamily)
MAEGLYLKSGAEEYGIALESFDAMLAAIAACYLPAAATKTQRTQLFESLHLADLALARACAAGNELAWERFVVRFRDKLYAAACAIARDDTTGRELADSLYSNLYGTRCNQQGDRISKLDSYTGRGSLEGWLRAVLAREYADRFRSARRLVSFESAVESGAQFADGAGTVTAETDPRLDQAVDEALSAISGEERFILASYYFDGRTLSEIARMLGVHESTTCRRLEKIKVAVRRRTLRLLRSKGVDSRQAQELFEDGVLELNVDVRRSLMQGKDGSPVLMNKPYE